MQNNQHYQSTIQSIHEAELDQKNLSTSSEQKARVENAVDVSLCISVYLAADFKG